MISSSNSSDNGGKETHRRVRGEEDEGKQLE